MYVNDFRLLSHEYLIRLIPNLGYVGITRGMVISGNNPTKSLKGTNMNNEYTEKEASEDAVDAMDTRTVNQIIRERYDTDNEIIEPVAPVITREMLPVLLPVLYRQTKTNGVLTHWNKSQPITAEKRDLQSDLAEVVAVHVIKSIANERGETFILTVQLSDHCDIVLSDALSRFITDNNMTLSLVSAGWKLSAK
jgi:hypothetical protein